jgi:multidrug efflux system outer membrane protein
MRPYLLGLILFAGCQLGPRYEVPCSPMAEGWKGESEQAAAPEVENWWDVFEDENLAALERQVIECNPNLYAALQKVLEARGVAGIAKSQLYPQASLQPSYNDAGELIQLYGVPPGVFPALKPIVRAHEMIYEMPLDMSYQVDIWERYYGQYRAAKHYVEAEEDAFRATLLTLTADLASSYFNAHTLDTEIELMAELVDAMKALVQLREIRFKVGVDSKVDLLNAEQILGGLEAGYAELVRQRAQFENAIAVLIGASASQFTLEKSLIALEPPKIPAGLPSTLLIRRPDIAQAERMMASYHALIGVAYASFFPQLSLTGALGFLSPDLSNFLTWKGRLWDWGFQVFQTVFDGFRRLSTLDLSYAKYRESEGQYQNIVLTAFGEVETALSDIEQRGKEWVSLSRSNEAADESWHLYEDRFKAGVSNQLEVLQYKIDALGSKMNLVNNLGLRYQSTLQLIKAIGGAWDDSIGPVAQDSCED